MRQARVQLALAAFGMWLVAGCGEDGGSTPPDCSALTGSASLVVGGGTTQTGFLSLTDGDDMTAILGPQGLWMVTPAIRAQNVWPGDPGSNSGEYDPLLSLEAYVGGTKIGASANDKLGLTETAMGYERLSLWLPFDMAASAYAGMTITIEGTVTDACGRTANDSLAVVVRVQ